MFVGFSTGSLAPGDFHLALKQLAGKPIRAIELSALRETELQPLVDSLDDLDLRDFDYVSVHAPSRFSAISESDIVRTLSPVFERGWAVVVHPDVITDWRLWREPGSLACIENMDKRKSTGRTAEELKFVFDNLPDASLCFDIAHARQVDPTWMEAKQILRQHGTRIRQIHLSMVASSGQHERLGYMAALAFPDIAPLLPEDVPIILESPVSEAEIEAEIKRATVVLRPDTIVAAPRVIAPRIISIPPPSNKTRGSAAG